MSGFLTPVGVRPVLGSVNDTYASGTWAVTLPLPPGGTLQDALVQTRTSAGIVKALIATVAGNVVTIADNGGTTKTAGDVVTIIYTIKY